MTWIYFFSLPRFCCYLFFFRPPWSKNRRTLSRFVAYRSLSLSLSHAPPPPPQMLALPATSCVLTFLPPPSPFFVFEISNRTHTAPIVDIFYSAHTFTSSLLFFFFSFLKDQSWRGFIGNRERIIYFSFFLFFSLSFESRHASPSILVWSRWI